MTLPGWGRKVLLLAIIPVPPLSRSAEKCSPPPCNQYQTPHLRTADIKVVLTPYEKLLQL